MPSDDDFVMIPSKPNGKSHQLLPQDPAASPEASDGQTIDLAWVFTVIRRRIWVIASMALILMVSSGAILVWNKRQMIPEYQGSFKLLVEPATAENRLNRQFLLSQNQNTNLQSIEVDRTSLLDYETQIRVLQSPKIIDPILKKLKVLYPEVDYNSLMASLAIYRMTFEKEDRQEGTKILEIHYKSPDTQKILFVLKTISDSYLNYSLDERQKSLKQGLVFIESQLPNLQDQVDKIQGQLQQLRQQYNLIDPALADDLLKRHSLTIREERLNTEVKLAETKALYATLKQQLNENNPTGVVSTEGNAYEEISKELQTVEAQIASQSIQFREDSDEIELLREKQANLQLLLRKKSEGILEKLAGQIEGLEDRYNTIIQSENQINQKLAQLPAVSRQVTDLQRQLTVATDNLKEFLVKREALKLNAAQQEIPWELINPPQLWRNEKGNLVPVEAFALRRPLAIAVILSILLGIGVGFLVEILQTVFHSPDEIKSATKVQIIGIIPIVKKLQKLPKKSRQFAIVAQVADWADKTKASMRFGNRLKDRYYSGSPFMEAFRSLYTTIRLMSAKKPIHSLAISSSVPGDGKTTISVYLGKTAATIGQRVLLIDTDLRYPQLHTRLDLPNQQGLSELITSDLSIDDAIQKSPLDENFFVLTSGQNLSDPIKLLSSAKMEYLREQFQARFDLVLYDTPPLLGIGDGNLIAAKADGTILVVGIEKTDRSQVMKAFEGLKISGASILGIVANGVPEEATKSYGSYRRFYGS
ncbi:MAG TPA: capsular biosynthesis protein [Cyanobacteria bacterium UBA11149]|nr:capsular biosynthesis protein [Cyanobacteria bacterium UBA11367]HBE56708.1 capsular biosynthesis protein [Cyanobacteria bacterium UBA11366]HBK63005.1 capsular biosynthesis protein [Cyanobacteria bacterium UBA11166]HBR76338.1 capsular biosynthesis protein [Cyanobacteria bacterium UBA11159]HBS70394.1 capsular biosynthesis protein [Cyanobacteria bacterium UBA11153]HBW87580.1 capsular biosynthesis protein [Cyanobacteria bacterium UBA11149]HCA97170.1 capsular biosynthesis protein [Cyanobacteria